MIKLTSPLMLACCISSLLAMPVQAEKADIRTLKNLERERAQLLTIALSPGYETAERADKVQRISQRLVDLERMVMRDDRLLGVNHKSVKRAFANYDMTFLAHASIEADRHIIDHWLDQQGINTKSILNARVDRR